MIKISDRGLAIVKAFEGYGKALPDGSCMAYQDVFKDPKTGRKHVDIPTIGYGCTRGVKMGMIWTQAEAEAALRRELESDEATVARMVTVELNQNEADALISLVYNIGAGHFQDSTLLRKLNRGDRAGAAKEFDRWNKAGGIVLKGLQSRRSREKALFLEPITDAPDDHMPQAVEPSPEPPTRTTIATLASTAGAGVVGVASSPPDLSALMAWQGVGGTVASFGGWLVSSPLQVAAVVGIVAAVWLLPKLAGGER
jgi:lysozyme